MNLKKYEGASMKEALARVKAEIGPNAVILHTRSYKRGGFMGLGEQEVVEITASGEGKDFAPAKREAAPRRPAANALFANAYKTAAPPDTPAASPQPLAYSALKSIGTEGGDIKSLIHELLRREHRRNLGNCSEHLADLFDALLRGGMDEEAATAVVARVGNGGNAGATAMQAVAGMIRVAGPIVRGGKRARTVALIGPTGVGKTTTIAKLAANFTLREKLDVGLITLDTKRIAAVQQLKTYADILGLPVNVVLTPVELTGALHAFSGKDIVLVDTAGCSQRDAGKIQELKAFLDAGNFDEVHLVISATTHTAHVENIAERFGPLAHDRMILTKIDESPCRGHIFNILMRVNKAAAYIANGQEVPDNIEVADAGKLAALILKA